MESKAKSPLIVVFVTTLLLQHWCSPSLAASTAPAQDREMMAYLEKLYQTAQSLDRPLVNGELNLLPVGQPGFANTVRCFFDTSPYLTEQSRILRFNLSALSPADKISTIQLVLKQRTNSTLSYKTQLQEIIGGESSKMMEVHDAGEYVGEWHILQVGSIRDSIDRTSGSRNYYLTLNLTIQNGDAFRIGEVLRTVKPMLLVYTNDLDWLGRAAGKDDKKTTKSIRRNSKAKRWEGRRRNRRSANEDTGFSTGASIQDLEELKQQSCQLNTIPWSQELQKIWPGKSYTFVSPTSLDFSFCYGTCNDPLNPIEADKYTNHALLMALAAPELGIAGASPCCVPHNTTNIRVFYQSNTNSLMSMTTYTDVTSCRCY